MAFYSYLFFSGNCREAFTRYQEIFGGELRLIAMADAPPGEAPADPAAADLIMHASLDERRRSAHGVGRPDGRCQR